MNSTNFRSIPKQRYYDQQLLKLEDFEREQNFHIAHRELQNQLLLQPGILTGLTIQAGTIEAGTQGQVQIMPGVALDNSGRLINLTDSVKFNNANILLQFDKILVDLSDQKYHNKTWLLNLEYNEEQDSTTPSKWKEIPKLTLIDMSTEPAIKTLILLAVLSITPSQEGASSHIDVNPSMRVNAILAPNLMPKLDVDKIPNLPFSKISGQFNSGQIPDLPASKIKGSLAVEQIPDLPTSKLIGQLSPQQIPDSASLKFYFNKPNIKGEEPVTLTLSSQIADKVVLEYIFENKIKQKEWNKNLAQEKTYTLEAQPYQTTTYTLTAYYNDGAVQKQKQFTVQVIPNEFQYLKTLYYEGVELSSALESCLRRYSLLPVTQKSIDTLIENIKRTHYSEKDALILLQKWKNKESEKGPLFPDLNPLTVETFLVNNLGEIIQAQESLVNYYNEDLKNGQSLEMRFNREMRFIREHKDLNNGQALKMIFIPEGEFMMGTNDAEIERLVAKFDVGDVTRERPIHQVSISAFFMGQYPITQKQWRAIATLEQIDIPLELDPSHHKGNELPVESVTWDECVEFCKRLSKLTEREYRLPSEAEWEYACRAGTTTPFNCGETITTDLANYDGRYVFASEPQGQYRQEATPVEQFPPNAFGLYDMHGNVSEWCADDWHDNYDGAPNDGSAWISDKDDKKVIRGGAFINSPVFCRSAGRYIGLPRDVTIGFRVVCVPPRTS